MAEIGPSLAISGRHIRRLRRDLGISQSDLARKLGISPSYLNLIEHGHRPLTSQILPKAANALGVAVDDLAINADHRTAQDMSEMFGDQIFAGLAIAPQEIAEAAATLPTMSRAILDLYAAYRTTHTRLDTFSERMANEPYLVGIDHEFRTLITSIRSFSEILRDNADLGPEQRQQFLGIIADESERLSQSIGSVLDQVAGGDFDEPSRTRLPAEEVADVFQANMNYFPNLEAAAAHVRKTWPSQNADIFSRISAYLQSNHGSDIEVLPGDLMPGILRRYDATTKRLYLSRRLEPSGRIFQAAVQIGLLENQAEMAAVIADASVTDPASQALCRSALGNYFAAALLMPYDAFYEDAQASRYDIERLGRRYGTGFEQVCHRLSTLQKPGAAGVPFHLVRVDIAGNISLRFSASGIRIPRYGGLCPRWNVHGAFLTPGAINRQISEMPDGTRYFTIARTIRKGSGGYHAPQSHLSIGIGCDAGYADRLIYADDLVVNDQSGAVPVGISCRLCPRTDCRQRAFPSFDHQLELDENIRGDTVHVTPQVSPKLSSS